MIQGKLERDLYEKYFDSIFVAHFCSIYLGSFLAFYEKIIECLFASVNLYNRDYFDWYFDSTFFLIIILMGYEVFLEKI